MRDEKIGGRRDDDNPLPEQHSDSPSRLVADVLIIGGGPAGSAAAITLRQLGRRVVLVDKEFHPRFHIGESLLPMSMPLFEQLGLRADIETIGVIKRGADFPANNSAGYRVFRFVDSLNPTWPHAVQVLREELDAVLFRAASDAGADARQGVKVLSVVIDPDSDADSGQRQGISATAVDAEGHALHISARYLIDSTGRDALVARQLRLRTRHPRHQSAALFAHFTGVRRRPGDDAGIISIYRSTNGWVWVIPLPGNLTSIGLVTGPEAMRERTGEAGAFLLARLREIEGLRDRVAAAEIKGNVHAAGNYSYRVDRIVGEGWIMAGGAAGFIDPIFSSGVHIALESGIKAAELVNAALHEPRRMRRGGRRYTRAYRSGIRRIEWFIERFNSPVMRYLFANPRKILGVEQAIISMLAGDLHRDQGIAWRLAVFKLIYHLHNVARVSGLWKIDSHTCGGSRGMDSWLNPRSSNMSCHEGPQPGILRVGYYTSTEHLPDQVLGAIVYGTRSTKKLSLSTVGAPTITHVSIETQPLPEIIECWQSDEIIGSGSVSAGIACNIRFTTSRSHLFAALEINEFAYGGLRAAARAGYEQLLAFQANSKWPATLRIWNYLDAINAVENGIERYREFCIGRLEGMGEGFENFPAASAIGRRDGNRILQLIWIAAKTPGIAVENPRQMSAYRYPERYGPTPPSFSRAVQHDNALIISGTASIVGHETLHSGDAIAQLEEAERNLHATASASSVVGGSLRAIKGYVRYPSAIEPLMTMTKNAPDAAPAALLADICRSDLLIELEALYAPPATSSP